MGERVVLGLVEDVVILGKKFTARIDSGATTSSIDKNLAEKLGLEILDVSKIVKSASGIEKRLMILAEVNINNTIIEDYFTIADRHHMTYSILIGQNILKKGKFLIDPLLPIKEDSE